MCPDLITLSAYFDRELTENSFKEVESHLKGCSFCTNFLSRLEIHRTGFHADASALCLDGGELSKFRRCVNRARLRRIPSVRFVAVPLPLAAAVLAVLLVLTVLNFMPIERRFPQSARLQRNIYPTTVVSLSLTPNDVENLIHLMEGRQGFDGHATTYVLPAELPVAWLGNPQVQNAAVHENKP